MPVLLRIPLQEKHWSSFDVRVLPVPVATSRGLGTKQKKKKRKRNLLSLLLSFTLIVAIGRNLLDQNISQHLGAHGQDRLNPNLNDVARHSRGTSLEVAPTALSSTKQCYRARFVSNPQQDQCQHGNQVKEGMGTVELR